ncbi:MAG: DUF58 domain-containing protein [Deltaproteobacteria bacterium]|nr:MAG: DUF58 domain-containing protein [Deltaproteobacteria bacterium]
MAVAHAAGYVVLHGAAIAFCDALGLFEVAAYFPNPIAIKVFPRAAGLRGAGVVRPRTGALHERVGAHYVRRRGLSGELREIRDHAHGDPFKFIAWKATARARRLMVRDLETEFVVTHQILLDIAGTMRHGAPGSTPLDYAIEVATGIARGAISGGDRVGLVTFDTRVYSQLRPGEGHRQFLQVVDRLVETRSVVDEDLTALTNAELVAAVARYLAHQEAIDVRLHRVPALDDPVWERVHAGPRGELYDIASMAAVVSKLLGQRDRDGRSAAAPAWWWTHVAASGATDPRLAQLRLFCRLRGIELPYRTAVEAGARAAGLADAVAAANAGPGRCDTAILLSDLAWFEPSAGRALEALALARRRGQPIVVVAPFGPAFAAPAATDAGARALRIATAAARARFDEARRQLARRGVPAIEVGPSDAVADVVARIAGVRAASRRAA